MVGNGKGGGKGKGKSKREGGFIYKMLAEYREHHDRVE